MEIISFVKGFNYKIPECIATIGAFDGLHLGHNMLVNCMDENKKRYKKMVITFEKHPDYSLNKREYSGLLSLKDDKIKYFESYNFDYFIVLNEDILDYSYQEFNEKVLKNLNVKALVLGSDFVYGRGGKGNISTLSSDFDVTECELLYSNGIKLSSQKVREYLSNGEVEKVKNVLGHNYKLTGEVKRGAGLGKTFGFPTANVEIEQTSYLLLEGVYACYIFVGKNKYLGVVNVGKNPTINTQKFPRVEAFIIDFDQEIYGEKITIEFLKMIRRERKFDSVNELILEIKKNVDFVKKGFNI